MSHRGWLAIRAALTVIVVGGLAVDAFVHFDLASGYAGVKTNTLSQADLFRAEGTLAVVAGLGVVVHLRRYTAALAALVSAGGAGAVVLYRYIDIGALGPVPNMYEPIWYGEKTLSAWAEGIAAVAALALLTATHLHTRQSRRGRVTVAPVSHRGSWRAIGH
jgi:hypothetical protein